MVRPDRVLYVDGDPATAEAVGSALGREDGRFAVETAAGADAALDRLAAAEYDCVVSAFDLSVGDGIGLLESVRERHPGLPFVLAPADGDEALASRAIAAGVSDYVPLRAGHTASGELADRVGSVLTRERPTTPAGDSRGGEGYREALLRAVTDPSLSVDEKLEELLRVGCDRFGLENGHLVRIDERRDRHAVTRVHGSDVIREGVSDLRETYCRKTVESGERLELYNAPEEGWEGDPAYETYGLACYLGGTVRLEEELYGTLCFVDRDPRAEPFSGDETAFFDLLSRSCRQLLAWRRRQTRVETVFQHVQDAVFVVDVDDGAFTVRRVNEAYEALTGVGDAEIRGKTPREIVGEDQGAPVEAHYRECVEREAPMTYEETLTVGGEQKRWQTKLAPVVEDDTVVSLVGSARDITDQRERERELREQQAFIDQSLDALEDIFYVVGTDGEMLRWNDRLGEATGYDEATIAAMSPTDFFPADHRARIADSIREVTETGDARVEADVLTADGERIPHELTGTRLSGPDGEPIGFAGVGRDVSDRRAYERRLERQNEQLERFASVVSHDLRNPLNVALGGVQLALETGDSDQLPAAERALMRMEGLIEDVLTLAREGERVSETSVVDLGAVAEAGWETVETGSADLVVDTDGRYRADPSRLQQLFENLFRNAVEHAGADVTVTVGECEDGFFVADDGPGVPAENSEAVFEPAFSTTQSGTGFGLAIVSEIADAHGWEVSLGEGVSAAEGARFVVTGVERVA